MGQSEPHRGSGEAAASRASGTALYSPEERRRRDASPWTVVQGVLAPLQFLIFATSLGLILRYVMTGLGAGAAEASVVIKTLALYAIMITGALWEKAVFGRYLFAPAFFWEDVFSFVVLGLHTLYLVLLASGRVGPGPLIAVALAGYAAYLVNAGQFLLKFRTARLQGPASAPLAGAAA